MKKRISILMVLVMCVFLAACGGVDTQPAIDAFNSASAAFDELANQMNANINAYPQELIDVMNEMAAAMTEHKEILESGQELTEEQIEEMIAAFAEVEQWAVETEASLEDLVIKVGDKQAVIDVFNKTSTAFDNLSSQINANIDAYSQETIDVMTQMANSLIQCKEMLESDQQLSEEEADALISDLTNIEKWVAEAEGALVADGGSGSYAYTEVNMQTAIDTFNAISGMFDATASAVNANAEAFSQDFIDTLVQLSAAMSNYKAILESDYMPSLEEYNTMMEDFAVIGQWLLDVESQVFG